MITAIEIPRFVDGEGVRLCHRCQRQVYHAGGYLNIILRQFRQAIKTREMVNSVWLERLGKLKIGEPFERHILGDEFQRAFRLAVKLTSERKNWTIRLIQQGARFVAIRLPAKAMETGTAKTEGLGAKHDSAVATPFADKEP